MATAKAVVFDFNGTLFFDYQENKDGWNEISLLYRGRPFEDAEYDSMMGMTDPMCVRKMLGDLPASTCKASDLPAERLPKRGLTDERITEIANQKEEIYLRLCKERRLTLEPNAVRFIQKLKADSIKVLIASSAPKINMDWYYDNLGLKDLFTRDYVIASPKDLPSKPNPDIFQYTLKVAQVAPEDAICFEDAPNGLRAALATPFKKVYGIESPGFDNTIQRTLAPMINWDYALEHYQEIISL